MSQTVTFVTHEKKTGQSAAGKPWALNIFKTADGFSCSTLKAEVAQKALDLIEQPVQITTTERITEKDGQTFKNFTLVAVEPASNGAGAQVETPKAAAAAPAPITYNDPKQAVITRSFGVNAALKALEIAGGDQDAAALLLQQAVALAFVPASYAFAGPQKSSSPPKEGAVPAVPSPSSAEPTI